MEKTQQLDPTELINELELWQHYGKFGPKDIHLEMKELWKTAWRCVRENKKFGCYQVGNSRAVVLEKHTSLEYMAIII